MCPGAEIVTLGKSDITHTHIVALTRTAIKRPVVNICKHSLTACHKTIIRIIIGQHKEHIVAIDACGILRNKASHHLLSIHSTELHRRMHLLILQPLCILRIDKMVNITLQRRECSIGLTPASSIKHILNFRPASRNIGALRHSIYGRKCRDSKGHK